MSSTSQDVQNHYRNSQKLAARARLHSEYTIAETPWFEWVAAALPIKPDDNILDIGCGPGWFWKSAAAVLPYPLNLTVADISPGMVQETLERGKNLPFNVIEGVQADAVSLPFEEGTFDLVMAMHMLYHLPEPAAGIAEMYRVLKPGGVLAVTTNGSGNLRELYELTTAFGGSPSEPVAAVFGFDIANRLMQSRFENVETYQHPSSLHVTNPEDVFLALTSYPPGENASDAQQLAFREAINRAFERGSGTLKVRKEMGLFLSRKAPVDSIHDYSPETQKA